MRPLPRWSWLVLLGLLLLMELWALNDSVSGNTLSGVIGPWLQEHPLSTIGLILLTGGLLAHLLLEKDYS